MPDERAERPKRVLICGSDEDFARRAASVLDESRVDTVPDAPALLSAVETASVDLILTDRRRSGKENVALLRQVNRVSAHPRAKVIVLARESGPEDLIAAMREGAFSYFSKPYFEAAFDEILRHAASDADWEDGIRVASATPTWLRLGARCELATADRVIQFMNEVSDLDGKERESVGFALKEILMNGMEYGGKFDREQWVEVSYVRGKRMVLYRVRDPGDGFSLEQLAHAAISNPPEDPVRHLEARESMGIRPGGFGVLLSRKLVDDLIYSEKGNDVLLIKYTERYLDAPTASENA